MVLDHPLQRSRFELKYIIDEATAVQVRAFARSYLRRDKHAIASLRYSYPVYSLYLDSPDRRLCRATVQGHMNRYKLRLRYYNNDPASPVFFEIKRRINDFILKERALVRRLVAPELLMGRAPRCSDLVNADDTGAYWALRRFSELMHGIQATGQVLVHYMREAWVSPRDDSIRLTFDRSLVGAQWRGSLEGREWVRPPIGGVVLELKFDNRFPVWMRDMAECCNLYRTSMAKYVQCTSCLPAQQPVMRQLVGLHL